LGFDKLSPIGLLGATPCRDREAVEPFMLSPCPGFTGGGESKHERELG
jgi:hypothetical protein